MMRMMVRRIIDEAYCVLLGTRYCIKYLTEINAPYSHMDPTR